VVAAAGETFALADGQKVTVRTPAAQSGGGLLEFESEWAPVEVRPPAHLHPHQDERFEVLEGELTARVGDETRVLGAGEVLEVPRRSVHEMWNAGDVPCCARWQVRPALRTEELFAAMQTAREHRRTRGAGTVTPVGAAPILREFSDELRPAVPRLLARPLLALLAGVARLRGYPPVPRGQSSAELA
jgi:mannose-6-phosphate isomerase-like protein (cupin superfamily)